MTNVADTLSFCRFIAADRVQRLYAEPSCLADVVPVGLQDRDLSGTRLSAINSFVLA